MTDLTPDQIDHTKAYLASKGIDLPIPPSSSVHYKNQTSILTPAVSQTIVDQGLECHPMAEWAQVLKDRDNLGRIKLPDLTPGEMSFRHSSWAVRRKLTQEAMQRCGIPAARKERFNFCGCGAHVFKNAVTGKYKVSANYCHDRYCEPCCRERAALIAANIRKQLGDGSFLFLTLTLQHRDEPLSDQITHLLKSFRRLRQQHGFQKHVQGGCCSLEIKIGKDGLWHPHLHIIYQGSRWPVDLIKADWFRASGGSYIVYIIELKNSHVTPSNGRDVASYVAKYASKGLDNKTIMADSDKFDEALVALRGRRLLTTFGTWRGIKLETDNEDTTNDHWISIGKLADIMDRSVMGDPDAIKILQELDRCIRYKCRQPESPGAPNVESL